MPTMKRTETMQTTLAALAEGALLKSHRYLDGTKVFRLHFLDGSTQEVTREIVEALLEAGYVTSNQKFPAATYLLTPQGRKAARNSAT
ncbi:MAG: hypothetical protein Kow0077_04080 [Anaerolineae bacterium]